MTSALSPNISPETPRKYFFPGGRGQLCRGSFHKVKVSFIFFPAFLPMFLPPNLARFLLSLHKSKKLQEMSGVTSHRPAPSRTVSPKCRLQDNQGNTRDLFVPVQGDSDVLGEKRGILSITSLLVALLILSSPHGHLVLKLLPPLARNPSLVASGS